MEPLAFVLLAFFDEGEGAAALAAYFHTEAACQAAIEAMPSDGPGDRGEDDGYDWAMCLPTGRP